MPNKLQNDTTVPEVIGVTHLLEIYDSSIMVCVNDG